MRKPSHSELTVIMALVLHLGRQGAGDLLSEMKQLHDGRSWVPYERQRELVNALLEYTGYNVSHTVRILNRVKIDAPGNKHTWNPYNIDQLRRG
ncbi:MAG: hypothetical protein OXN95_05545 [bacterium]|nr:hypothetical protein [bacterium]